LKLNINNETSRLRAVVLGTAQSNGPTPKVEEAYDPKSKAHILAGTYPLVSDMMEEMAALEAVFKKYEVTVFRPDTIENCNQIFARDIAFVIEDKLIISNILPDREPEIEALQSIINTVATKNIYKPPLSSIHIEGGDVIVHGDYIFVGTYKGADYSDCIVARTNMKGVQYLQKLFPHKIVKEFDLNKSTTVAKENALHLDCCFQPVGKDKAIVHREGFREPKDLEFLIALFGEEHIFFIDKQEMYDMNSNIFSIAEDVVISEKNFTRLNTWLRSHGITVEEVPYAEIAKQEGLLRCSTMPLIRD